MNIEKRKKQIQEANWGTDKAGLKKQEIKDLLTSIGEQLGYKPVREVNTGFSRIDLVWFDRRLPTLWLGKNKHLEKSLVIPRVGFEIEEKTYVRKVVRGDIDSLNSLSPDLGVIVFSSLIKKYTTYNEMLKKIRNSYSDLSNDEVERKAKERTEKHWETSLNTFQKFAAASQSTRIVILEDEELLDFARKIEM